jgi:2'-5' RNA ligase
VAVTPSYAIVAIASQDDYVWRLSSEKKPHLTLLYLGNQLNNLPQVEDYIAHAVDTSMCRFGMDVVNRGPLGPHSADVLFFGQFNLKKLENFRAYLLANTDILQAYNSTEQHPEFVPHLTMGFPETPAKPDLRDYPGTPWVNFDKIALWTGDSEGVEFPLKPDEGLAMSAARGQAFIQHHGIKGMKWGVRRASNNATEGHSEDAMRVAAAKQKLKKAKTTNVLTTKELQHLVTRMNLEQQFATLAAKQPTRLGKGQKFLKNTLTVGKTVNDVVSFVNSPAGKLIRELLKK